jgi:hypothetical protein
MIHFPPEFFGLVAALWSVYQFTIWIWFASTFSGIVLIGLGIIIWSVVKRIT